MTPMTAAILAAVAALFSIGAAIASVHLARTRSTALAAPRDLGELEQAVEDLVRRLEVAAGRCIHDLESRENELRRLLSGEADGDTHTSFAPAAAADRPADEGAPRPARYFGSELVSRAAQACELAERETDEATICRVTGLQRGELRLMLSLRQAQQKAA